MAIAPDAPRGGLRETLGEREYTLILRHHEIERIEDKFGSIFAIYDGFFGRGVTPTSGQVKAILAFGLVGGGTTDAKADEIIEALPVGALPRLFMIGRALIGVAFYPDAPGEMGGDAPDGDAPKKT